MIHKGIVTQNTVAADGAKTKDAKINVRKTFFSTAGIWASYKEIRYKVGDTVVDFTEEPGVTTIMKGVCSIPNDEIYDAAGWNIKPKKNIVLKEDGTFTIMTPVKTIFGCFEGMPKHMRMSQEFSFHKGSA